MDLKRMGIILAVMAAVTGFSVPAWSHKVNVFAYVERGTVHVEGYFPDGKPAGNAAIQVLDSRGRRLLEGRTDAEGLFSFPLPKKDDLTIVIDASMGHRNQFLLKKQDLGD